MSPAKLRSATSEYQKEDCEMQDSSMVFVVHKIERRGVCDITAHRDRAKAKGHEATFQRAPGVSYEIDQDILQESHFSTSFTLSPVGAKLRSANHRHSPLY